MSQGLMLWDTPIQITEEFKIRTWKLNWSALHEYGHIVIAVETMMGSPLMNVDHIEHCLQYLMNTSKIYVMYPGIIYYLCPGNTKQFIGKTTKSAEKAWEDLKICIENKTENKEIFMSPFFE